VSGGGIFLLRGDDELVPMTAQPYDTEDVLQALLARFPDLLAGDQLGGAAPRRWLLISRETAVPSEEDGAGRWSLDHLFVDQDAVPTLVEVKRSSDTRIRREVVGQMLDYAANAVVYWPIETVIQAYQRRCERDGLDPETEIAAVLSPDQDADTFWEQVAANLQAGRVRLVFVADEIPRELRRIVEFLNEQMTAHVIAIEVKQYVGDGVKTLVPRVIGETAAAETRKRSAVGAGRRWDEQSFFAVLEERRGAEETKVAREIKEWASKQMPRFTWGKGKVDGSFIPVLDHDDQPHYPIALYTDGRLEIQFMWLTRPPFDDLDLRRELLRRLNEIPGLAISDDGITRRPRILLDTLRNPSALASFLATLDWFCETVRRSS
jgi:hypothetical protein